MNIISRYLQACDINAKRLIDTVGIGAAVNCVTLMFIDSERVERCHQPAGHGERSYWGDWRTDYFQRQRF